MSATALTDELSQLLKKHHVNQAIIIDDAFDLTCAKTATREAIAKFAATVGSDKDVADELKQLGIDPAAVIRADEQALKALVAKRESWIKARAAVEELLLPYFEQIDPLNELRQHLDSLNIPTTSFGVAKALPDDLKADIAFIDYYLEQEPPVQTDLNDKTDYGKKAREQAQAVYKQTRAHIVLMSNRSGVKNHVTEFRQRAKLLKGYFRFAPKEDLAKDKQLRVLLAALPLSADFRHKLHDFIDALDTQSEQVNSEFMAGVRDLGLEDYAQIRQLSLNVENRPFGDYILRMFGAYLTSLVLEDLEIVKTVSELDKTSFEALLPLQDDPSQTLGRIYLASLTERVRVPLTGQSPLPSVVVGEPQKGQTEADEPPIVSDVQQEATSTGVSTITAPSSSPAPPTPAPVEFGDLLVKDVDSPVYAVVNPACDLVFRKKGRQPKDTLLLLPGDLRQLHEPPKGERSPSLITPLYLHTDNNVYRIDWDYRRLTTVPHNSTVSVLLPVRSPPARWELPGGRAPMVNPRLFSAPQHTADRRSDLTRPWRVRLQQPREHLMQLWHGQRRRFFSRRHFSKLRNHSANKDSVTW